jgi:hypothetical protein
VYGANSAGAGAPVAYSTHAGSDGTAAYAAAAVPPTTVAVVKNSSFAPNSNSNDTSTYDKLYDSVLVDASEICTSPNSKNPLAGLSAVPTLSLMAAAMQAHAHCGGDVNMRAAVKAATVFAAQRARTNKLGPLSKAEAAVINLYTQQKFHRFVNGALNGHGKGGLDALHRYLPYIKLLNAALLKLPPQSNTIVYRGCLHSLQTLIPDATVGKKGVWWCFTSTSRDKEVRKRFAPTREGTLYQIVSNDGRDISQYSSYPEEKEILLLPGSQLVIDNICPYGENAEVQMQQLVPVSGSNSTDSGDGEEVVFVESTIPPVYDTVGPDQATEGGSIPSVVYSTYAGSTDVGADAGMDQMYAEGGKLIATAEAVDVEASDASGGMYEVQGGAATAATPPKLECARGQAPGGKACHKNATDGGLYCLAHTCTHPGCGASKSRNGKLCIQHTSLAPELRPRAQTAWENPAAPTAKHGYKNVQDAAAQAKAVLAEQHQPHGASSAVKHGYVNVQNAAAQVKAVAAEMESTASSAVGTVSAKAKANVGGAVSRARPGRASGAYGFSTDAGVGAGVVGGAIVRAGKGRASGAYGFDGGVANEEEV